MKTVTYKSGHTTVYDDTLKIGDLVSTYNCGYHVITAIEDRGVNYTPLIVYTKKYNADGTKAKRFHGKCDACYVRLAQDNIIKSLAEAQSTITNLSLILNNLNNLP